MQVHLRFQNETHEFILPMESNVAMLMNEIEKKLSVPMQNQKIIHKGKPLNSLQEPLSNGLKLLLMSIDKSFHATQPKQNHIPNRSNMHFKPQIIDTLKESYHQVHLVKGPPLGCMAPSKFSVSVLPNDPLIVLNGAGVRSTLYIESDALFIVGDDNSTERIFFTDITSSSTISIPGNEDYIGLGMFTLKGNRWIYFIPGQYSIIIKTIISNSK